MRFNIMLLCHIFIVLLLLKRHIHIKIRLRIDRLPCSFEEELEEKTRDFCLRCFLACKKRIRTEDELWSLLIFEVIQ